LWAKYISEKVIFEIERVLCAEEDYAERIPENLKNGWAFASAEYTVDILIDAIGALGDTF
jgi:hypothetical protein